jgi:glycosyltransferase involved in cell wall biosynthesis
MRRNKSRRTRARTGAAVGPRVTIVTPSFNHGAYIGETIRSVVTQDYPNLEYWIIDGGSTDDSLDIIRRWAGRCPFLRWISEPDRGQSDALNKGFRRASGEIVAWLNSDDLYEPGAVRRAAEFLSARPSCMLAYSDALIVDERGRPIRVFPYTQKLFNYRRLAEVSDYIAQPSTFIRKAALDRVGLLDESLHWCMDWDLWLRIAQTYPALYFPSLTARMRDYAQTKTRSGGRRRWREIVAVARRHSGRRFPPAYFIYGLESLATRLKLDRSARARLKGWLLFKFVNHFIDRHLDIYPDGWAAREIEFSFYGAPARFVLEGAWPAANVPARLEILLNGRPLEIRRYERAGAFSLTVGLPLKFRTAGRNALLVRSSRFRRLGRPDRRRVSFRLIDSAFENAADPAAGRKAR